MDSALIAQVATEASRSRCVLGGRVAALRGDRFEAGVADRSHASEVVRMEIAAQRTSRSMLVSAMAMRRVIHFAMVVNAGDLESGASSPRSARGSA